MERRFLPGEVGGCYSSWRSPSRMACRYAAARRNSPSLPGIRTPSVSGVLMSPAQNQDAGGPKVCTVDLNGPIEQSER